MAHSSNDLAADQSAAADKMTQRTRAAARESLTGARSGARAFLPFAGPAVVASVAYMDPGNFATNLEAGARFGYTLLWVVLLANLTAMLFQGLSAKLGIVSGKSLARVCRDELPRPLVLSMWVVSEIAAMATDLAELLGAAIGLQLLTGLPLMACLTAAGGATLAILKLEKRGFRPMEIAIGALVLIIGLCYLAEILISPPDWKGVLAGLVTPQLADSRAVLLAVGIVGATVMPHAIYLHSSLTQQRTPPANSSETRRILRYSNIEVGIALGVAGLINIAMVCMAASAFAGRPEVAEIEIAYRTLIPLFGGAAAFVFLVSLLASGFSSSVVGTMAGQTIMQDFLHINTPLWLRRAVTMIPAFAVVAMGVGATQALVMSQVALSLVLPVPMAALVWATSRPAIMGDFTNSRSLTALAAFAALIVIGLNVLLLLLTAGVPIAGLNPD